MASSLVVAPAPSPEMLRDLLRGHGLPWRVEARARLAILTPPTVSTGTVDGEVDPSTRRWLVQAAQRAGFSHIAIEVGDIEAGASVESSPPQTFRHSTT